MVTDVAMEMHILFQPSSSVCRRKAANVDTRRGLSHVPLNGFSVSLLNSLLSCAAQQ